jgi:hypothetical protein
MWLSDYFPEKQESNNQNGLVAASSLAAYILTVLAFSQRMTQLIALYLRAMCVLADEVKQWLATSHLDRKV